MKTAIEAQLRLCPQLPTLPGVAFELISIARRSDVNLNEVTRLIGHDPALATKILRIANSPLYHQFRRVHSLAQAVRVLGLNSTVTLALSFALEAGLRNCEAPGIDLTLFWRRALIAAWAAWLLGEQCQAHALDELFLAGLLQDIGRLALDSALPEEYAATQKPETDYDTLLGQERDRLGTDHLEAGAWLVRDWQLPEYLPLAIWGSHDRSLRRGPNDLATFIGCVATSGRIADIYVTDDSVAATASAQHVASACLGLDGDALTDTLDRLEGSLAEIATLFETPALSPTQVKGMTDQARELIVCRNLQQINMAAGEQAREDEFKQMADQLYNVAHRDALTGLFNRRHFDEVLGASFAEAGGNRQPLSLAYLDLDHFKAINDQYGHLAGDAILVAVSECIRDHLRPSDLLARYGGEEFVVLLPGLSGDAAYRVIERIRAAVAVLAPALDNGTALSVTLSAGVAAHRSGAPSRTQPTSLMHAADQALYAAKDLGRNRVVVADDDYEDHS